MTAAQKVTRWPRTVRLPAAVAWQALGARVLPLHWIREDGSCSCGKDDCGSPGKHPIAKAAPRGVHDAVRDLEEIQAWWTRYPEANIGIATGDPWVVLDVDPRAGGDLELARLESQHGPLPETAEQITGGGGRHLFFAPDERFKNSAGTVGLGIDTKGTGGYIVGAGSNHASGGTYEHELEHSLGDVALAAVPAWLLQALDEPRPADRRLPEVLRKSQRNPHLWREACALVRRGWTAEEVVAGLMAINQRCDPPGEAEYVARLARRAHATYRPAGRLELAAEDASAGADAEPLFDVPPTVVPQVVKEIYSLTDVGNRDRLVDRWGHRLRYCSELGHYLIWDGIVWHHATSGEAVELAIETIAALPETERGMHLVPGRKEGEEEDALPKWVKLSRGATRIGAMVQLAQSHSDLQVGIDDLDQAPWLLTTRNGTIDLLTGRLTKPDPRHLITMQSPVVFDPGATAPRWNKFIWEVMGQRDGLVACMQEFLGYCLTGTTSEALMLVLYGQGSNGKSIMLDVIAYILGQYAKEAAPTAFMATRESSAIRNDLAALRGARFVTAIETSDHCRLDMSVVKRVTGGDPITARFLHQEFFSYRPQFKLLLATNHEPEVTGADHGTWRRVRMIPFDVQFGQPGHPPAANKDQLTADMQAEAPGILNWLVEGCKRWRNLGLSKPEEAMAATRDYRDSQDALADFFGECVLAIAGGRTTRRELYNRYVEWCEANHARPYGVKGFGQKVKARGIVGATGDGIAYWKDINLRAYYGGGR